MMFDQDDEPRVVRLRQNQMARVTIIVTPVTKVYKFRFAAAMALMRIAGRIGGFKNVKLAREQ